MEDEVIEPAMGEPEGEPESAPASEPEEESIF